MLDKKSKLIACYGKGDIVLNIHTENDYYPCDIEFRVSKCADLSLRERVERLMNGITDVWVLSHGQWRSGAEYNELYIPDKEAAVNTLGKMFRIPHLWDIVQWIRKKGAYYKWSYDLCFNEPNLEECPFLRGRKVSHKEEQQIYEAFILVYGEY
jgi:hypothetical protein